MQIKSKISQMHLKLKSRGSVCRWWSVLALVTVILAGGGFKAHAFIHPGIPLTTNDLDDVKNNLANYPWSQGYAALLGEGQASTNYVMAGPFGYVNRAYYGNYDNEGAWKSDMTAIWDLSRMWYFTKDNNYAQKAHDILIAWATTMTNFGGNEAALDLGDYSSAYGNGADILRGTWPGWTAADTLTVSNFFKTVYLPATFLADTNVSTPGPANKGALQIAAALACAVFNDDTNMFNHMLYLFRTTASCGVHNNSLNSGEMGETGRDQGHSYNYLLRMAFCAEVFYKQGIDVYSEDDNRLLADGEYYARNNLPPPATFIPFGTIDWYYLANSSDGGGYTSEPMMGNILRSAYVVRKGLTAPWMVRKRYATPAKDGVYAAQVENSFSFCFLKSADASTAVVPPPIVYPTATSVTSGFTDLDIGGSSPSGSSSYTNGIWTVTGGGTDIFTHNPDSCHFVYKALTGDCTMIAKVNVVQPTASNSRAGVMIRDSLSSSSAYRAFMTVTPSKTGDSFLHGYSQNWGGRSNAQRPIPQTSYWVKLERLGDVINLYVSPDGTSWGVQVVGQYSNLPSTMYVGLVVCSEVAGAPCTATFSNVSITGGDGGNVTVPAAPYYVYASPDAGQVPLRWLTSFGASSYSVYRSLTNGGPYTLRAAGVTNASYIDTNVAPNTTYYYVVTATNSAGASGYSTPDSVTTQPAPAAPTGLTALPGNGSVTLLWAASSGATNYIVKRSSTSGSGYLTITNLTGTSWVDTALANGTTYYYVVSATGAAGEGTNSPEVSVTPSASAAAYIWSGAVNGTWDTSTANWLNNGGPATYQNGFPVIFDDSVLSNTTVSLPATRSPSAVIFNNSVKSYSVSGNGIGGTCGITLFGNSIVTLNGTNTFTGGTTLNNGTLVLGNGSALGTGAVTANGGTLKWNYVSGNANVTNNIVVNGAVTFETTAGNWTQSGPITGSGTVTRGTLANLSLYLAGDNSGFTGTYQDQNNGNAVTRFSANTAGSANARWIFNQPILGKTSLPGATGTIRFGSFSGSGTLSDGGSGILNTVEVGALGLDDTFSGVIGQFSGTIGLTKVGTGTMTLLGANTYTGPNNINAGKLLVTTASAGIGNYTVANGATLSVSNVTTSSASISNLTLAAGSTLEFMDINSTTTPLLAANNVVVNGACTVKISLPGGIALGTYPLASFAGSFSGNFANLQLQLPAGISGTLVSNANQIAVSITAIPVPAAPTDLVATSRGTQIELDWSAVDFASGYNIWRSLTSGGGYTLVGNTTNTTFMDSGLAANQTYYYVLTATNNFGSSAYSPEASATTQPALKWTGAASVNWDKATTNWVVNGLPSVYQDDASVWFDDTALSNIAINVTATMSPAIMVVSNSSKSYSFSGNDISGTGSLLKLGSGTVTFNVANTYSGGTTLSNGMIVVGNGDALGAGTITANGGTLKWNYISGNGAMANNLVVNGPVTFDTSAGNWTINGPITGSGTITRGTSGVLSLYLAGDNSGFTGTYQDQNNANSITRFTANTAGSASARWKFNQPVLGRTSLPSVSGAIRFGSFSGSGTLSDGGSGIVNTVEVGALGLNDTFSGVIGTFSGTIGLTKVGTGTMTLLGANTYTGLNNITAGKLVISTASLAKGSYLVASNATFAVTNTTTGSAAISNLTVSAGSALEFQRVTNPVTPLIVASNLTVNGSCLVTIVGTNGLKIGTNYPLISYSGTFSGQLTNLLLQMPGGYGGTLVNKSNVLTLAVTSTNTPSGLAATPGNNEVFLNWTAIIGATNYNVKRATTSGGPYTVIASSTTASYTDFAVTNGTTYYYVVSALGGSGESPNSIESSAVPLSVVQTSLQTYLKFDESSGTNANDATGNGWDGTLVNDATFVAGYSNNAVNLNSNSLQYVTLPTGVVNGLSNFTITAWAKQTTTASWMRVFDFGTGTATYMFLTPLPGGASAPRFAFKLNNGAEQQINGTSAVSVGTWHHFAVTLNGSVGILYVDGVAVGTNSSMTLNPSSLGNTTQNYLGKSQWNDPYFNGQVDEFRIYHTALSASEVATLITPLAAPTGLAATAGDGQITLGWNTVTNAAYYQVFRSLTNGGPYTQVGAVVAADFTDTGLLNGTNYFYILKAINDVGTSANSAQISARPVSLTPPTTSAAVVGNQLQLSWPVDHTGWHLQVNTNLVTGNWQDVPGSDAANYISLPPTNVNAFFRLVYP
jgi:autotransporter-associated beta strand protein